MTYKPLSVVVVPFPFTDSPKTKKRPALVLSNETFQKKNGHVTLAMITTAKQSAWLWDLEISDLDSAGLPVKSIIRQKIFTVDNRLVEKQIGVLGAIDKRAVRKVINDHFCP